MYYKSNIKLNIMAKGIITTKPSGSVGTGKITVTNSSSSSGSSTAAAMEPGSTVDYSSSTASNLGDIVDFTIDASGMATNIKTIQAGTVITGVLNNDLTVAAGESVLLNGTIDGKVSINGGSFVAINKSKIGGKMDSKTAGSCVFVYDSVVDGKIDVSGASEFVLQNTIVEGKVNSDGNIFASVTSSTIKGNLDVTNATTCKTSGNTVDGKINTPNCK